MESPLTGRVFGQPLVMNEGDAPLPEREAGGAGLSLN